MFYFVHNKDKEVIIPPQEFNGSFIGTQAQLVIKSKCEEVVQYMKDNDIQLGFVVNADCKEQYENFFELKEETMTEEIDNIDYDEEGNEVITKQQQEVGTGRYIVVNFL
jgi:hypothetical protein